jgi:hypothetical protein
MCCLVANVAKPAPGMPLFSARPARLLHEFATSVTSAVARRNGPTGYRWPTSSVP